MTSTRRPARALLAAGFLAALIFQAAAPARARQGEEPPRRPQGPAAGPVIKLPRGASADAEQRPAADARPAGPRKWEYCAITGFVWKQQGFSLSSPHRPSATIRYFSGNYEEVEGGDEEAALANAFAKLGEEGWELTGVRTSLKLEDGHGEARHAYFFKRPKPVE